MLQMTLMNSLKTIYKLLMLVHCKWRRWYDLFWHRWLWCCCYNFARTTTESANVRAEDYFTQDVNLQNSAVIMGGIGFTRLKAIISMSIDKKNSETISNPKLFALDGQSSTLAQGNQLLKEIGGGSGQAATTVTIDQDLNMTVTPKITSDNQVELKLLLKMQPQEQFQLELQIQLQQIQNRLIRQLE